MGNIISSLKDCFNNMFSKSTNNIPKEEFNIKSKLEENNFSQNLKINDNNQNLIPLLDLQESHDNNNLLSPKNSKEKYKDKDAYQSKDFKSKITLDDFQTVKVLGTGAFGKVSLVYNEELKRYFAMKTLKKDYIKKYQQTKHTKEERIILEKID